MNTTDKILADRLRRPSFSKRDRLAAADRIEQLAAINEELSNCVAVLEAKLAKAVELALKEGK